MNATTSIIPAAGGSALPLSLAATALAAAVYFVGSYVGSPLRQYPGPFLASALTLEGSRDREAERVANNGAQSLPTYGGSTACRAVTSTGS